MLRFPQINLLECISAMAEEAQSGLDPGDVLARMDRALIYVSKNQKKASDEVQIFFADGFKLVGAIDAVEFGYLLQTLVERNLIETRGDFANRNNGFFRLTHWGWEKVDQLSRLQPDSNQAFVAMSFDGSLLPVYQDGIKPALVSMGFHPYRADMHEHDDKIDDVILTEIQRSGLVVADFTGNNHGAYFESGYAMGLGIHVIRTCKEPEIERVHFDTGHYNHILWNTPVELRSKLEARIEARGLKRK